MLPSRFSVKHQVIIRQNSVVCDNTTVFSAALELPFDDFMREAYGHLQVKYPKFFKMDGVCKLAMLAAHALSTAGAVFAPETAVLLANQHSTRDSDLAHYATITDKTQYFPSPSIFAYTLPNIAAGEICIRYHIKGENMFFIQNQPDWHFLANYADDLLQQCLTPSCLVGWVDCAVPDYEAVVYFVDYQ